MLPPFSEMIIVLVFFGSSFKGFLILIDFVFRKFLLDLLDAFDQLFKRRLLLAVFIDA